jgi:DNA-binding transcriptional regulator GbsR (MarR family)
MTKLTRLLLEQHQDETINTLDKEIEAINKKIEKLLNQRDVVIDTKAKFMAQILMAQTKWKLDEQN